MNCVPATQRYSKEDINVHCYGRKCELGWGWNGSSNRLIPVEGKPPNVTSEVKNNWESLYTIILSSTSIPCWVSFLLVF